MGNYYVKAGTVFDDPACKFYVYVSLAGYDEDDYTTVDDSDIVADDPYLIMGGTGGEKEVVIGLDSNYRIRITDTGIEAWDEGGSAWVDLIGGGIAGNVFKEIDCPAGTNPLAVGPIDTLVLTATGDIVITGDNVTNTVDFAVTKYTDVEAVVAVGSVINDPTGFPNRTDSSLAFDDGTRKITINPTGASFDIYQAGVKTTISTSDVLNTNYIIIGDTSGIHAIYYDSGVLNDSINPSEDAFDILMTDKVLVALIYWNATDNDGYLLADERHGVVMSGRTHQWAHDTIGATYSQGLTLSDYVEDVDDNVSLTFKIENGEIYDEDISVVIIDGNPAVQYEQQLNGADAELPILYRDDIDSTWKEDAATTLPYKSLGAGRLAYNKDDGDGTFSQVEVTDNAFVTMTIIATNDWQYPIKAIQGQTLYTDKKTAVEEATNEILAFGNYMTPETIILYRIILNTKDTFGGTKKAKIVSVVDFRTSGLNGAAAAAQAHGTLSGLSNDDHAQYLLVDGTRAMGAALDMGTQKINNVVDPAANQDAATKKYHDDNKYTDADAVSAVEVAGIAIETTKALAFDDGGSVDVIRDENDMASNDVNAIATQKSIKTYVDASAGADADAIHVNADSEISGIANKAAPVDADYLVIEDSEDGNDKKHITIGDLPGGADPLELAERANPGATADFGKLFVDTGNYLKYVDEDGWLKTVTNVLKELGFTAGGLLGAASNVIDYIDMNIIAAINAVDKGDLTVARWYLSGLSGIVYDFYYGGNTGSRSNVIDLINRLVTSGNATDKGDLTVTRDRLGNGVAGEVYGFMSSGLTAARSDVIDYIDVELVSGNAVDRGNLVAVNYGVGGVSGKTYGFIAGGSEVGAYINRIQYIDLRATTGNATDGGDLSVARGHLEGVSGELYGMFGGGDA